MKVINTFLDNPELLFDSDQYEGMIKIEINDDFEIDVDAVKLNGKDVLRLHLSGARVGRFAIYPSVTNGIMLGKDKL